MAKSMFHDDVLNNETITPQQFEKMLGLYRLDDRENHRYYPSKIQGAFLKSQCELFVELLMLEALRGINHSLTKLNSKAVTAITKNLEAFRRYQYFLTRIPDLVEHKSTLCDAMMLERARMRANQGKESKTVDPVRADLNALKRLVATFPDEWGKEDYMSVLVDMAESLKELRDDIFNLGVPLLFNSISVSPVYSARYYAEKWLHGDPVLAAEQREEYNAAVARCAERLVHYTELMDEYKKSTQILNGLNQELRADYEEVRRAYNEKVENAEYFTGRFSDMASGRLQADEEGYFVRLPAGFTETLALGEGGAINIMLANGCIVLRPGNID